MTDPENPDTTATDGTEEPEPQEEWAGPGLRAGWLGPTVAGEDTPDDEGDSDSWAGPTAAAEEPPETSA